jgi:sugar phosphate isomerase/epimerase
MKTNNNPLSRRQFIQHSATLMGGAALCDNPLQPIFDADLYAKKIPVNAHLWVYASKFPPNWDCTPNLETLFADLSYAGINGVELMEVILRHDDAVKKLTELRKKYNIKISGSSYGVGFNMWDAPQHDAILKDIQLVVPRLGQLKAKTFGISVGDAKRLKTETELDAQADLLKKIIPICKDNGLQLNLHNHTYEVANGMPDLKGTLQRIPDIKLGPDLNWLIRAGVDPVAFINTYGKQIVYLHIRDQYKDGTWTEAVGQGVTDFPAIAAALKAQKFRGSAAIELAFPNNFTPTQPLKETWKQSREHVRKVFGW